MNSDPNRFICPECGSEKIKETFHYQNKLAKGLYSNVLHEVQCGSCFMDIPGHLGKRLNNISADQAKDYWLNKYKAEHIKEAAKCSICSLYYFEIEKKLEISLNKNKNIFMQKFTQTGNPDLICRICEPDNFK
tara:strand:- start:117 stop:515 length:399 start_codon:yes stop_codon:yes gene_type:complete